MPQLRFTLRVQRENGKPLKNPREYHGAYFETHNHSTFAWVAPEVPAARPLHNCTIALHPNGVSVMGFERDGESYGYQEWWLVPEPGGAPEVAEDAAPTGEAVVRPAPGRFEWTPDMALGVEAVDAGHRTLLGHAARLAELAEAGDRAAMRVPLTDLIEEAVYNFAREEGLLDYADFPATNAHRHRHEVFLDSLRAVRNRLATEPEAADPDALLSILDEWIADHVRDADRQWVPYVRPARAGAGAAPDAEAPSDGWLEEESGFAASIEGDAPIELPDEDLEHLFEDTGGEDADVLDIDMRAILGREERTVPGPELEDGPDSGPVEGDAATEDDGFDDLVGGGGPTGKWDDIDLDSAAADETLTIGPPDDEVPAEKPLDELISDLGPLEDDAPDLSLLGEEEEEEAEDAGPPADAPLEDVPAEAGPDRPDAPEDALPPFDPRHPERPDGSLAWREEMSVGVPELDAEHKDMLEAAERLRRAREETDPQRRQSVVGGVLAFLAAYTETHFEREARIMEAVDYPQAMAHAKVHRELKEVVHELKAQFDGAPASVDLDLVYEFLRTWLVQHILKDDRGMMPFMSGNPVALAAASLDGEGDLLDDLAAAGAAMSDDVPAAAPDAGLPGPADAGDAEPDPVPAMDAEDDMIAFDDIDLSDDTAEGDQMVAVGAGDPTSAGDDGGFGVASDELLSFADADGVEGWDLPSGDAETPDAPDGEPADDEDPGDPAEPVGVDALDRLADVESLMESIRELVRRTEEIGTEKE